VPPRRKRARGHIEQLHSGSYRAVVYVGIDPLTRKEHYLKETANSYAQAKVALTRLPREVDEEAHPKTSLTVGQAIQQWLDVAELEDTTRERYDELIQLYVLPTFGDLPQQSSTPSSSNASTPACTAAVSSAPAGRAQAIPVDR
jgi:integrase